MLADVGSLQHLAVVEVTQHGFAFDEDSRIADLPVPFFAQPTDPALKPVARPMIRLAGEVCGLCVNQSRGVRRLGLDASNVGACARVLYEVSDERHRIFCIAGIPVEPGDGVEQSEPWSRIAHW